MNPKLGGINIGELNASAQEKVLAAWQNNRAAVAIKRGKNWQVIEVDERNDDISSYSGYRVFRNWNDHAKYPHPSDK